MRGQHVPQRQKQGRKRLQWTRITIASIVLLLIITTALLWILNIEHVIQGNLSPVLSTIFTILGVAIAFFAWFIPPSLLHPPPHIVPLNLTASSPQEQRLRIWNVPYLRNPFFTGRKKLLTLLHDRFNTAKTAMSTQVITGLGGIGKTQIALEYAYRYRADYRAVLWINAATRDTLISDFVKIAILLQLPERDEQDQSIAVAAVRRWLEENTAWLLILDNANDLTLVCDYLPTGGMGHTLLVTRLYSVGILARAIEVQKMEQHEAILLVLRRAKILAPDASPSRVSKADRAAAAAIVTETDGLPLALDQAGAYIAGMKCKLAEYLELYQNRSAELLALRGSLSPDHPEPVATTWSLCFRQVEQTNHAAADLLRFFAFLDPDAIPEELFLEGAFDLSSELQSIVNDPFKLNKVFEELQKFSLVQRNPQAQTFSIHRLVQAVLKGEMKPKVQRQWAERTVRTVSRVFPEVEVAIWSRCQRYLPHAQICAGLIAQWDIQSYDAVRVLSETGRYLYERAQYKEAEPLYQRALVICEQVLGSMHPHVAHSLNNLASLSTAQGKYEQVEQLYQQMLEIEEKVLGPTHPLVATNLNDQANLYADQGKYKEAEPLYKRALAIREEVLGPDHLDVARSHTDLAILYMDQGKYKDAEPLYKRALAIREEVLGPNHPNVAYSFISLAILYMDQGKYKDAEELMQRARNIYEKVLGPEHPQVAHSLNNLASLYMDQGKYKEAEPLYKRALAIREEVLGSEHPQVAYSLNNLASLYANQGKHKEAEPLFERVLEIRQKTLGLEHPNVAYSLNSLANLYADQGKYEQAELLYQRVLEIKEQVLGRAHPDVVYCLNSLVSLYIDQGKYEQAEPLYRRIVEIRGKLLGRTHLHLATTLDNYAALLQKMGREDEAAERETQAREIRAEHERAKQ